ncbi:MAG: hypothetical protein AMJ76_02325 [Dehalococcoidia bacterium SM23_28_1]|nr:MAG: hypothetical protein AMJ76_02325 [Dehalococcoidia bacterium SM23_28_1]
MVESARRLFRAELVTDSFCMAGRLDLPPGQGRLVDILNFAGEHVIVLHAVEARRLGFQSDKVFNWPTAQIRREAIILAIPQENRLPATEAQHPLEYVAKEPHRVSFLLAAFAVIGDLHLARGADINAVSPVRGSDFVPLTDAEAVYLPDPALVWKAPVIIVNVARAQACCLGPGLSLQQFS